MKKKVVYAALSFIPSRAANSIHVMKMCNYFCENGIEITLLIPDERKQIEKNVVDLKIFYGIKTDFKIIKIPYFGYKLKNYIFGILSLMKLLSLKPDLVHTRFLFFAYLSALFGVETVFESHLFIKDTNFFQDFILKKLLKSKKLKKIITNTVALKVLYEENYEIKEGLIIPLHNGGDILDMSTISNREKLMSLQIGYMGHLYSGRGIEVIMYLAKNNKSMDFHIIGGMQQDIEFWKNRLGSSYENIIFHGFKPQKEALEIANKCDILLAPYQKKVAMFGGGGDSSKYMCPLKILDYMALGKAILVSDLPVLHELLLDEVECLFCKPDNFEDWDLKLKSLDKNRSKIEELSLNAKEKFLAKLTWEKRAKKIIDDIW